MRVVSWFSCGAASAVATILAAIKYGDRMEAVYCRVREEHEDNLRFLHDFERVMGIPVKIIMDEKHDGSIFNVFLKRGFIKGPTGAPCTMILKKWQRQAYQRPGDIQVFGYTVEEQDRMDRFLDGNNEVKEDFILASNGVTKAECYKLINQMGIELPAMYRLGYENNNCIGCVKGGMGYWNKIRTDFPARFEEMSRLERLVNHAINKDKTGPVFLDTLDPRRGNFKKDIPADCGFTCEVKGD